MAKIRRKVAYAYKDAHWHTYWQALFECGHWGFAPNVTRHEQCGNVASSAICDRCTRGEVPTPEAVAAYLDRYTKGE